MGILFDELVPVDYGQIYVTRNRWPLRSSGMR